jgi:23S rRNA pseudouridine2605 synthase
MEERLQKIIARSGLTSRRAAEDLITAGRVRVNGRVMTELGAKADPRNDRIEVDGTRLVAEPFVYLVLHKPKNVVSTMSDPEGRPTVAEYVRNTGARVYPIGRLDFATSGVLLMTNDGDFSNGMLHPRGGVPKTYIVKVNGVMGDDDAMAWRQGIELEDGKTLPADVHVMRHEGDKTWMEVTLREGRNQQIRRMGEATRFPVMRLARISFAGVTSDGLLPGKWRLLTQDELMEIRKQFGVPKRVRAAAGQQDIERLEQRGRLSTTPRTRSDDQRSKRQAAGANQPRTEHKRSSRVRNDEPTPQRASRGRNDEPAPQRASRGRNDAPAPQTAARGRNDEPRPQRASRARDDRPTSQHSSRERNDAPTPQHASRGRNDAPTPQHASRGRNDAPTPQHASRGRNDAPTPPRASTNRPAPTNRPPLARSRKERPSR